MGIVGSVVDGVPESAILGIQVGIGMTISLSFVAAALGFLATDLLGDIQGERWAALAAGGLLAMLTNSLIPFSFERGGALAGAATALGFCLSVINS
jgi:ZIP family zinc transporter